MNKYLNLTIFSFLTFLLLSGCHKDSYHLMTVPHSSQNGFSYYKGGETTPTFAEVERNSNVTISAEPYSGYIFEGWYEDNTKISTSTDYTYQVKGSRYLLANFIYENEEDLDIDITLHYNKEGSNGYSFSYGRVYGMGRYPLNKQCTVDATPAIGYNFAGWYEDEILLSTEKTYTFNVEKSVTLKAVFSR